MNKKDLIKTVALEAQLSVEDATKAVNITLDAVMQCVAVGADVRLPGFGTFSAKNRAARTGYNMHTGEQITVPATTVPVFRPGKQFKTVVAG